jgi:hypothetical protein
MGCELDNCGFWLYFVRKITLTQRRADLRYS